MSEYFESNAEQGPLASMRAKWQGLSTLGKLAVSEVIISTAAMVEGIVNVAEGADDTITYELLTLNSMAVVGTLGYVFWHNRTNPSKAREFDRKKGFQEVYQYTDADDETFESPFPVAVLGIKGQILGLGKVIGSFGQGELAEPVVAIQDEKAKRGHVLLLGSECYWTPLDEEIVDAWSANNMHKVMWPASLYASSLDRQA